MLINKQENEALSTLLTHLKTYGETLWGHKSPQTMKPTAQKLKENLFCFGSSYVYVVKIPQNNQQHNTTQHNPQHTTHIKYIGLTLTALRGFIARPVKRCILIIATHADRLTRNGTALMFDFMYATHHTHITACALHFDMINIYIYICMCVQCIHVHVWLTPLWLPRQTTSSSASSRFWLHVTTNIASIPHTHLFSPFVVVYLQRRYLKHVDRWWGKCWRSRQRALKEVRGDGEALYIVKENVEMDYIYIVYGDNIVSSRKTLWWLWENIYLNYEANK